jgi:hypothetical protein
MSPDPFPTPISAPDLTGPTSILDWPTMGAGSARSRRPRPFAHVHLEVDLRHERLAELAIPVLRQFEQLLREREVVEPADLLRLTAGALHAFASRGFSHVDHWEIAPGGWLPLPEPTHRTIDEPVGHLLRALQSDAWQPHADAREFRVRVSGHPLIRADLVVRRVHRERGHSISIDLTGRIAEREVRGLLAALRERVPVLRAAVTAYRYSNAGKG